MTKVIARIIERLTKSKLKKWPQINFQFQFKIESNWIWIDSILIKTFNWFQIGIDSNNFLHLWILDFQGKGSCEMWVTHPRKSMYNINLKFRICAFLRISKIRISIAIRTKLHGIAANKNQRSCKTEDFLLKISLRASNSWRLYFGTNADVVQPD